MPDPTPVANLDQARLRRQAARGVEPWLSKRQIAEHLNVSTRWVEVRMRDSALPSVLVGGMRRYRVTEVDEWLRSRQPDEQEPAR